jgi:serine/threonine protein kinase
MLVKSTSGPFTDLWSLGVIIYQIIAGCMPWSGSEYQMYQLIKTRHIEFPMDMPLDAVDLIDKLMQLNPLERLGFGPEGFEKLKSHEFFK